MIDKTRVVLVTDPMCSWCWGMAAEFEQARQQLADRYDFDLLLGGINTHGTQPIGDYGRRFLMKLWQEVTETTGQRFGFQLPEHYVHNSVLPCMAIEVVRQHSPEVPFLLLRDLQEAFFLRGVDITNREYLASVVAGFGVSANELMTQLDNPVILERVRFQFEHAGSFGTQALPSMLIEADGALRLLAGGYLDAAMMQTLLTHPR